MCVNRLTFWKILGISLVVHLLFLLIFRGAVIHSIPAPSFPHTRFVVTEWSDEGAYPGTPPRIERHYRVPTQSVELPVESPKTLTSSLPPPPADSAESLLDHYRQGLETRMNFFGLSPSSDTCTIFLIDISGSMLQHSGTSTRLTQAYDELKKALANLKPEQSFNIVLFAERVNSFSPRPLKANRETVLKAYRYLDSDVDCGGSTNLQGGLRSALAMRPDSLVLLSDGIPTSSEPGALLIETRYLREKMGKEFHLYSVGFYLKAGSAEEAFLQKLARQNNGTYARWNPSTDPGS
jgi:hypothetical protein